MPASSSIKTISLVPLALFAASISAQSAIGNPGTTTTSSFDWASLISAADTAQTTFDLYTTNGSLGPGVLDTSSRYGLYTTATPIAGPNGNGTVANGTATNGTTASGGSAGTTGATTGAASSGAGASGSSSSESAGVSAPAESGNAAAGGNGVWVEGAGLLMGLGALMAAL